MFSSKSSRYVMKLSPLMLERVVVTAGNEQCAFGTKVLWFGSAFGSTSSGEDVESDVLIHAGGHSKKIWRDLPT